MNLSASSNPLAKHFRQPKLYVTLPSKGYFYPKGSLETTETGEIPVLAMTAKDELRFKTPDALLNGQSTVDVIQSCIPNIKNAWNVPSIDVDYILIAIRIATYGEKMSITTTLPNTDIERSYDVDLRILLDQISSNEYENIVSYRDWKFEIAPTNYKNFTDSAMKTFEEQRILKLLDDDNMSEVEKIQRFNESFTRLTDLNIGLMARSVVAIQYQDEDPVTDPTHIAEFFDNADKDLYKAVLDHIESQRQKFKIKSLKVVTGEEERAAGAPEEFMLPIVFDRSDFFA
jgi:hypothetical protein